MTTTHTSVHDQVQGCLRYLDGQCDGARERDGTGFNKIDATFGKSLAVQENLSPAQVTIAAKMVRKYRKQLERGGYNVPTIEQAEEYVETAQQAEREAKQREAEEAPVLPIAEQTGGNRVYTRGKQVRVAFDYDPVKVEAVRPLKTLVKGWKFNEDGRKEWSFPVESITVVLEHLKPFDDFVYAPDIANIVEEAQQQEALEAERTELERQQEALEQIVALETITPFLDTTLPNGQALFAHQKEAILLLIAGKRMIVAHDMGLGKSRTSLMAAKAYGLPVIVICPASLHINWLREAEAVDVPIEVWSWAKLPEPPETDFVLIADEAHYAQNLASARTKGFLALAEQARKVFALTGTPLKNGRPVNLYPLLVACKHPVAQDRRAYERTYCAAHMKSIGRKDVYDVTGASHLDELHKKTRDVILYKKKEECLKDLPPKVRILRPAEVSAEASRVYDTLLERLRTEQAGRAKDKRVAALAALQEELGDDLSEQDVQAMTRELAENDENAAALVELGNLRHAASMAKVESAVDIAQEVVSQDESIVLFTAYRDTAARLAEALQADCLTGDTTLDARQAMIDRFQAHTSRVLVCMLGAGGVGITLTAAQTVLLVDRPWTPGDAMQAEDRLHRIGQKGSVTALWLQYGAIDEKVDMLLQQKQERIDLVLEGKRKTMRGIKSVRALAKDILHSIRTGQPLTNVEEENETAEPVIEASEEVSTVTSDEPKAKHAGGRPQKGLSRVDVTLSPEQVERTQNIDRSALIRQLLNAHFGIEE